MERKEREMERKGKRNKMKLQADLFLIVFLHGGGSLKGAHQNWQIH